MAMAAAELAVGRRSGVWGRNTSTGCNGKAVTVAAAVGRAQSSMGCTTFIKGAAAAPEAFRRGHGKASSPLPLRYANAPAPALGEPKAGLAVAGICAASRTQRRGRSTPAFLC